MKIISTEANPSGAYPPIQSWNGAEPPDGYYQVTEGIELSYGGFGELTIEDGIVTAFTPVPAAWEAWKASLPTEPEPTPDPSADRDELLVDHEYRLTLLELGGELNAI